MVLLGGIQGNPLLQVRSGQDQLSKGEQDMLQRVRGSQQASRVVHTLSQAEALLRKLKCCLQLLSSEM